MNRLGPMIDHIADRYSLLVPILVFMNALSILMGVYGLIILIPLGILCAVYIRWSIRNEVNGEEKRTCPTK